MPYRVDAQAKHKGRHQGGHDTHDGREADLNIGNESGRIRITGIALGNQDWDHGGGYEIGDNTGSQGGCVCESGCTREQFSGLCPQFGDPGSNESDNDQRHDKPKELTKKVREGIEDASDPFRQKKPDKDTRNDSDDEPWQQADTFHGC